MGAAAKLTILFSGAFFMTGLATGIWKWRRMVTSEDGTAPQYVDIAHRASLMYAFASLVVLKFVELSPLGETWTLVCAMAPQIFFAMAVAVYIVHGALRDTDNQFARPHRLGSRTLPGWLLASFMVALIAAELGGFGALFIGVLVQLLAA